VPHVIEPAASGRAKCRGCGLAIARGELRFGERIENPFAEGETTIWFHPACAAYKRPESLLALLAEERAEPVPERERLEALARASLAQRRLQRIDAAELAPSGQARCRSCREPIERGSWRIRLVYFEQGRFVPGGFVHLACRRTHFETFEEPYLLERLLYFTPGLAAEERADLARACAAGPAPPGPA
jgi:hypothetical protein